MIILYTVYPRWRGEHAVMAIGHAAGGGLSPLARGTQIEIDQQIRSARFIPAGAGNTHPDLPERVKAAVYPRWRGEHGDLLNLPPGINGLSPLARGTRGEFSRNARLSRFIPAGAGNTSRCRSCSGSGPVYPRWRGEHHRYPIVIRPAPGLSPLARGTHRHATDHASGLRFIPAGAGNTCGLLFLYSSVPVYPRWRGEHAFCHTTR